MPRALIKMAYQQTIDADTATDFAEAAFEASHREFLLKSQAYNPDGKLDTFSAMKAADGRANSLHYKTGFAVSGYIGLLDKRVPHLRDTLGAALLFDTYRFELLESSISDKQLHRFAIHYLTDTLSLLDSFGDMLLLAYGDKNGEAIVENTFMLKTGQGLSIVSYQAVVNHQGPNNTGTQEEKPRSGS